MKQRFCYRLSFTFLAGLSLANSAPAAEPEKPNVRPVSDEIAPPKFLAAWGQEGTGPGSCLYQRRGMTCRIATPPLGRVRNIRMRGTL
jgi:hypothetical protein